MVRERFGFVKRSRVSGLSGIALAFAFLGAAGRRASADRPAEAAGRQASEEELKALLDELSKKGGEVHSLEVKFRQEKKLHILRRPRISTGGVAFDGPPFKLAIVTPDQEGKGESRRLL